MTTYHVTATRHARRGVWELQCAEHPEVIAATRQLSRVPDLMREAIASVADVPSSEVDIELRLALSWRLPEQRGQGDT